jgi:hypothetical protein
VITVSLINAHVTAFLAMPSERRRAIYNETDKQTLGRLAQTCKQVNDEINPTDEEVGQEASSPWDTLRKREYQDFGSPGAQNFRLPRQPQNARSLYQSARRLYQEEVRAYSNFAVGISMWRGYLTVAESGIALMSLEVIARMPNC